MSSCANPTCQMTIQQCLDALEQMKRQMEIILPYLPQDVRDNLNGCQDANAGFVQDSHCDLNKTGFTKIVAAKQNADGSFTKMFALKREIPKIKISPCDSLSMTERLENADVYPQDKTMLYNKMAKQQRDGTLTRLRSQVENRLGYAIPKPPDENDPIGELEEMQGPQPRMKRTFAIFSTIDEAEEFLMVTINQIVTMFSKIAETLKNDSITCMKDPPKDKCLKDLITEKCMALLLDLELSMTEPINKLKEEWVVRFRAVIPELDPALCNIIEFQNLENLNNKSIARHEAKIEAHIEAAALNQTVMSDTRKTDPAEPQPEVV